MNNKKILKELNIENLPNKKQVEIIDRLENIIMTKVLSRIIKSLSDESRKEYMSLLKEEEFQKTKSFLKKENVNFDEVIKQTAKEVIEEFKR